MKTLMLSLSLALSMSSAQAVSSNSQFYAVDDSVESQLCLIAATQGYKAALEQGKKVGGKYMYATKDTTCNGISIKKFANSYKKQEKFSEHQPIDLFAANKNDESQLCVQAVKLGIKSIAKKQYIKNVKCNGLPIEKFVKQYGKI